MMIPEPHCWGPFYGGRKRPPLHFKVRKKYPKIVFFLPELGAFGYFSVLYGFTKSMETQDQEKGCIYSVLGRWYLERYIVGKIMKK